MEESEDSEETEETEDYRHSSRDRREEIPLRYCGEYACVIEEYAFLGLLGILGFFGLFRKNTNGKEPGFLL